MALRALAFMAAEIVHDHQVAGFEGRDENLIDIGAEDHAIDRAVDDAGRVEPVAAQRRQEVRVRHLPNGALATRRWPLAHRPCVRVMFVFAQVSSMKTSRAGSMVA